ncbi:MAG: CapA family protein, partial [Chloroflexi bacterium]|nr:CapA family protein [Chloroflexota bacterium]
MAGETGFARSWRPDLSRAVVMLLLGGVLAGTAGFVVGSLGPDPGALPSPSLIAGQPGGSTAPGAGGSTQPSASSNGNVLPSLPPSGEPSAEPSGPPASGEPSPTASPSDTPGAARDVTMPIVPVVGFWSTRTIISTDDLTAALRGTSERFRDVIVGAADREAVGAALGIEIAASVRSGTVAEIRSAVREGALGLLRAADVTPAVRALGIDDRHLFGIRRTRDLARWPLLVTVAEPPDRVFDPATSWTLAAAGDVLLDRGVARQVTILKKGVDFPFDGGRVEITGSRCCSARGFEFPTYRRTGDKGAVRDLMKGADLAMINLEGPVDDDFRYHDSGTVFHGDPKLLAGLKNAGIDYASLANNHMGDAGPDGVLETVRGLDDLGVGNSGAGKDLDAAKQPASYEINGVRIGVIGCDWIAPGYWARSNRVGTDPCSAKTLVPTIRAAAQVHDLVIVYPHWGIEYQPGPSAAQRRAASSWMKAGADLILGNHPHWVQGFEEVQEGKFAFYALGNFVFDQMWQENTMEGLILELTYS